MITLTMQHTHNVVFKMCEKRLDFKRKVKVNSAGCSKILFAKVASLPEI